MTVDDAERVVFRRVLDALLREDHLGLSRNGRLTEPGWWLTHTPTATLRIPVEPDGFQHAVRSSRPEVVVLDRSAGPQPDGAEPDHRRPGDAAPGTGASDDRPVDPEPDSAGTADRQDRAGAGDRPGRRVRTLDGLLDLLTPVGDPEAEAGWAEFRAECRDDLIARRLAARTASRVHAEIVAGRPAHPDGMAGALRDDVLAARLDHPVYPTSRCRHGLTEAELLRYAPEHAPTFALRWSPVPRTALALTGPLPSWWPAAPTPDRVLLPVHPVTAARRGMPVAADVPEIAVRPTLSMRTVALAHAPEVRLKLPLATATLGARNVRTIAPGTLDDGATMHRLLTGIAAAEPAFAGRILHADESVHGHVDDARAFLLRRFPAELAGCRVVPVAALAATDPTAGTVAQRVGGRDPWPLLASYLDLLLDWHGYLWLRHGIALEAHQQNLHLVLDPTDRDGARLRLLYQDNDGARLVRRPGPTLRDGRMWVTDPGELADVFTTITLHLAAAAPLRDLAARGMPLPSPGAALRPRLVATRDRWAGGSPGVAGWDVDAAARMLTARILDADHLPIKAMVTAGTLLPKSRTGCADVNKYYLRTGPNYLRPGR
jgi:hypothetical protein